MVRGTAEPADSGYGDQCGQHPWSISHRLRPPVLDNRGREAARRNPPRRRAAGSGSWISASAGGARPTRVLVGEVGCLNHRRPATSLVAVALSSAVADAFFIRSEDDSRAPVA